MTNFIDKSGTCNCNSNWVGQGCDIFYQDLICPNNCSGLGTCDLTAGMTF